MERISIFNYEAFYLDFLEGNLSENDCVLLFEFLEKHPELKVDLEDFPVLEQPSKIIEDYSWDSLKQIDFELDAISMNSVEQFIIADLENQLSPSKQTELNLFIAQNKEVKQMMLNYQKTILVANKSIVYPKHSELKYVRKIALWPVITVAASLLVFFFTYQFMQTGTSLNNETGEAFIARKGAFVKRKNTPNTIQNNSSIANEETIIHPLTDEEKSPSNEIAIILKEDKKKTETIVKDEKSPSINKQDPETFITKKDVQEEPQLAYHPAESMSKTVKKNDNSMMAYADMENPIKPITKRISQITNTEVDYKTTKKTLTEERRGFYLKIGNLEVERPKRK